MFQTPPEQIVIAYTEYEPLFEEMKKTLINWICIKGCLLRNRSKIGAYGFSARRYDDESCKEREIFCILRDGTQSSIQCVIVGPESIHVRNVCQN